MHATNVRATSGVITRRIHVVEVFHVPRQKTTTTTTHIDRWTTSIDTKTKKTKTKTKNEKKIMMHTMKMMMQAPHVARLYTPTTAMDALFEHVMGDFASHGGALATHRACGDACARREGGAERALRDARAEETERGYLITATAPGVRARDVEAEVETDSRANASLRVKIRGKTYDLGCLPAKYLDVSVAPKASCIDGVLRVAILKKMPMTYDLPVSADEDMGEADDDEHEDDTSAITLRVPGFGARDIAVTLRKPEDELTVTGQSKLGFGEFTKTFKNLPAALESKHISATCAHGVLTIKMADPDKITPLEIVVSSAAVSEDAFKDKVVLLRRVVPGTSADKITCAVGADRVLNIEATTTHSRSRISIPVPRDVDYSTIQAVCADGVFTVVAERDAEANASHSVHIEVSGEHIAALAEPPRAAAEKQLPPVTTDAPTENGDDDNDGVTIEDVPM